VKIFLDTNVLVSAVISRGLCRDLLRTATEEHDVVVSQLVVDEFKRVLRDKFGATPPALDKALMLLDDVEVTTNPTVALEAGVLETNDALILTAAINAQADVLVTGDHGMLAKAMNSPIDVVSPRGFMELIQAPADYYPGPPDETGGSRVSEDTAGATRQKAFEFALSIIALCKTLDENRQYVLSRQLLRAGTSIGANIEEASAAESRRDFAHKMAIASKEARETNYWLRLLDQSKAAPQINLQPHLEKSLELIRLLTAIVKTTSRTTR
jgi:putative PIN family toxin of toxin-antitoxin system